MIPPFAQAAAPSRIPRAGLPDIRARDRIGYSSLGFAAAADTPAIPRNRAGTA
jgi:hypothetical protein